MISWCSDLDGYVPDTKLAVRLGINPRRLRRQIRCRGLERVVIGRLSPSGRHGYLPVACSGLGQTRLGHAAVAVGSGSRNRRSALWPAARLGAGAIEGRPMSDSNISVRRSRDDDPQRD